MINATQPTSDRIFDPSAFTTFLKQRIKVDGRTGNLGDNIEVSEKSEGLVRIVVHKGDLSGRYIKYLYVALVAGRLKRRGALCVEDNG